MNSYGVGEWASCPVKPASVREPFLMGTGVIGGEDVAHGRPISPPHRHPEAMLAWCYRGTLWVHLAGARWRLAPGQGIWLPPGTAHTASHDRDTTACYTYVRVSELRAPIAEVTRVLVPRAVQEMMLHLGVHDMDPELRVRIQSVLLELLQEPGPEFDDSAGEVPLPVDERVRPLVDAVLAAPGDPRPAKELFAAHGLHERTVLRVFSSDIGMSFGKWRTGVRMSAAARLMLDGTPVGAAGQQCGYDSTSAFSAAFKGRFGVTPRQYVARALADAAHHPYWR